MPAFSVLGRRAEIEVFVPNHLRIAPLSPTTDFVAPSPHHAFSAAETPDGAETPSVRRTAHRVFSGYLSRTLVSRGASWRRHFPRSSSGGCKPRYEFQISTSIEPPLNPLSRLLRR